MAFLDEKQIKEQNHHTKAKFNPHNNYAEIVSSNYM